MKDMKKIDKGQLIAIIVGVVVVSFLAGFYILPSYMGSDERPLKGVLLETGDIYFGTITYFPRLTLHDVYTVQVVADPDNPSEPIYQVVPLEFSIWGPDKIVLNYDKIVFIGDVGENSQVMQAINQQIAR